MRTRIEVVHCAGWNPRTRQPVGTMSEDRARERDEAGEPYAVLLGGEGRQRALLQVSWRDHYLGVFLFDERERRVRGYDYRELAAGLLHLRRYEEWRHTSADEPEFPENGWHFTLTARPDSETARVELDHGGSLHTVRDLPEQHRTLRRARFGDWTAYADARMLGFDTDDTPSLTPAAREEQPDSPAGTWSVPRGLRPRHLQALFTPGSRFAHEGFGTATVTSPETAGVLRLPTGSVMAADPATLDERDQPFTVPVPPGEYPVVTATMKWDGRGCGENTAAMLRVLDKPTVSWELAVRPGQDTRLLGEGEFYGFGVDSGMAAFLDAAGRDVLAAACEHGCAPGETTDPDTGTNLIAYHSGMGDGSYPVWIGRTAEGEVTCLVADMLILHRARPLPPTVPDTTTFLTPPIAQDAPQPRPGNAADASNFISAIVAEIADFKESLRWERE
ncbi:hypothetical protein GCM10010293_16010 [Streptomyces griseoflavus]|uniref:DUF4241 domain-containing protein n=1 Tax=Streptomyces griseoflavus TaxID=35619 RepID=UPI00167E9FF6|nr:DUF4241 domain-containing protein [Streptomyces griseoflavus]GGV20332.1 hypothetical protein GCM10010293_16010 [Streptomyces griseoflavus]